MTDYEAKFHELGTPINRLVATMVEWEEPEPTPEDGVQENKNAAL
jgi:tRNA (guanine-N7-)-methyltransferase